MLKQSLSVLNLSCHLLLVALAYFHLTQFLALLFFLEKLNVLVHLVESGLLLSCRHLLGLLGPQYLDIEFMLHLCFLPLPVGLSCQHCVSLVVEAVSVLVDESVFLGFYVCLVKLVNDHVLDLLLLGSSLVCLVSRSLEYF